MYQKDAIAGLIVQVLDGTELRLKVDAYSLHENLEAGDVKIECAVHDDRSGAKETIDGHGVGIVDAFFHGMVKRYSGQFPSLNTIRFSDFIIKANLDTARDRARSDSTAEVTLRVMNSEDREYSFTDISPSITRSALKVVSEAVAFFINSERAFIAVYSALQHARKSGRADSIARYTTQLATLVEATSYSEVIAQIRQAELAHGR